MSLKGDFAKLAILQARIKKLTSKDVATKLANLVGAEALKLVQMGFRQSEDPYGAAWAPLKHRAGKALLDSGRLRSSFSYHARADGFEIGTNVSYAKFHQYGTNGRKAASSRSQGINKRGRFARGKRVTGQRMLSFGAGSGRIPSRMMVPERTLGPKWSIAFRDTSKRFISKLMRP